MIKRYEVVRDDGDYAIGLGYSYAYYQLYTDTGTIVSCDRDFTKVYEDVTGTEDVWTREDIAAIKEGFTGGKRHILYAREIPLLDILALMAYLDIKGFDVDTCVFSYGSITITGRNSIWEGEDPGIPYSLFLSADAVGIARRATCEDIELKQYLESFGKK